MMWRKLLFGSGLVLGLGGCVSTPEAPSMSVEPAISSAAASGEATKAGASAEELERAKFCSTMECRGPTEVKLRYANGDVITRKFQWFNPVVQDDAVTILPGETLYIEAEVNDGRLTRLHRVDSLRNPGKTLVLKFSQATSGTDMLLSVSNPFLKTLKYHLAAMATESSPLTKLASCPVRPGTESFETWPNPVFQLVLMQFEFASSQVGCSE